MSGGGCMKKSRYLFLLVIICFGCSSLFASQYPNKQKIFSLDSDVYEAITSLYVNQGLSLPSTTGPYSEAELVLMLEKIKVNALSGATKATYEYILEELDIQPKIQNKGMGLSWDFDANLETYTHTNTTDFTGRANWNRGYISQKPLLAIGLETWPSNNFYGFSEFTVGNTYTLKNGFGSTNFSTNILMVSPNVLTDLDFNMPYRAFISIGGDFWTFQLGRDRLSWGAGESGNLFVGDNIKYHNMARFTAFGEKYKYTFVTSFFPHPKTYIDDRDIHGNNTNGVVEGEGQTGVLDGIYMFMAHRLEWRMFNDKVGLTLTESIMYQSEENCIDLRILNPVMIFHDYYIRGNANSLLGLELDYTPIHGINLYGQVVVDEFVLPGEPVSSDTVSGFPTSFGYLAGIKAIFPIGKLMARASLEGAYTDPYLYLRYSSDSGTPSANAYGLNYVVAIREFTQQGTFYNSQFLGYKYGGDAIVVNLNGGVKQYGKWNVEANGFYMIHGTFDMYTRWDQTGGTHSPIVSTPTTSSTDTAGNYAGDVSNRNSASHTLILGVNGSYEITSCLKVFGQLDYINITNYQNVSGAKTQDVQLTVGLTFHL